MTAMAACGGGDYPPTQVGLATENDVVLTNNGDVTLLGSYHELFDKSADTPCVKYEDGGEYARVSEPSRNLTIDIVRDKEELARKLGVDLKVKARYGVVSGNAAVNLLDELSSSTNSVTFLLSAQADYMVRDDARNGHAVVLTDKGLAALEEGAASFARKCGTHYASGVRYGGRFYLLIQYRANDHSSKTQMDASLGVDASLAGSGDLKTRLEETAKMSGIQVSVKAASSGFWLAGAPSAEVVKAFESSTVDQNLFAAASQLYLGMTKAVERDYCLDSGQATCDGEPSPGYFKRSRRDVSVTGVQLAAYHSLSNVGADGGVFGLLKQRTDAATRFIRAYSEIQVRMDGIYYDEVKPFLDASPQQKASYNVAPPAEPLRTAEEVSKVVQQVDEEIYPPKAGVMGWLRSDVYDRLNKCLDEVNVDIMASCTAGDTPVVAEQTDRELEAEETKQWTELYRFFDAYQNERRVLPLEVAVGLAPVTSANAPSECDDVARKLNKTLGKHGSSTKVVYRLATEKEVRWLAPVMSHGNVKWTGADIPHASWYSPIGSNPCGANFPYYQSKPSASPEFGCSVNDYWDDALVTLCVPTSGPVPVVPAK